MKHLLLAALCVVGALVEAAASPRPNVLLIVSEDNGPELGCYGDPCAVTPQLGRLASCSSVKGFIGRGFAADGRTTWPIGSNDQTAPWFYGLWRYVASGLAEAALRRRIVAAMSEAAEVLVETGCDSSRFSRWRAPGGGCRRQH